MLKEIFAKYSAFCPMVFRKTGDDSMDYVSTAFFIASKGYLLTSAFTLDTNDSIHIAYPHQQKSFYSVNPPSLEYLPVTIQQIDHEHDLALLKTVDPVDISVPLKLFDSTEDIACGTCVGYLGYPVAHNSVYTISIMSAIVSSKIITPNGLKMLQIDGASYQGTNGGPVINTRTGLISGITSNRYNPVTYGNALFPHISYAITIEHVNNLLQRENLYIK